MNSQSTLLWNLAFFSCSSVNNEEALVFTELDDHSYHEIYFLPQRYDHHDKGIHNIGLLPE